MQPTKLGHLSLVNQGIDVSVSRQDEYSILPYSFIIGVHGYVLVYSVTSLDRIVSKVESGGLRRT